MLCLGEKTESSTNNLKSISSARKGCIIAVVPSYITNIFAIQRGLSSDTVQRTPYWLCKTTFWVLSVSSVFSSVYQPLLSLSDKYPFLSLCRSRGLAFVTQTEFCLS
jgi:hypothetical protein